MTIQIYTEMGTHVSINALTGIVPYFFKQFCFVCYKLYKAKKNYLNSHGGEEAQEKPPGSTDCGLSE